MSASIISLALSFLSLIPDIKRLCRGSMSEGFASSLLGFAKRLTHKRDAQDALATLQQDRQLLLEFQKYVLKMHVKQLDIRYKSLEDARKRELALFVSRKRRNFRADLMVLAALLGLLGCLGMIGWYRHNITNETMALISTVAGIFGLCLRDAYRFEFGEIQDRESVVEQALRDPYSFVNKIKRFFGHPKTPQIRHVFSRSRVKDKRKISNDAEQSDVDDQE